MMLAGVEWQVDRGGVPYRASAMWFARNPPPNMPLVVIHSVNPDGAKLMQDVLIAAGFRVERNPAE